MRYKPPLAVVALWVVPAFLVVSEAAGPQNASPGPGQAAPSSRGVINRYCFGCHNQRLHTAELALDTLDPGQAGSHAEVWEKVALKLRTRVMPPLGARRPDEATYQALIGSL